MIEDRASEVNSTEIPIIIFQDEDGMFIAECPAIPGCVSQGKTQEEVEHNIQEALVDCVEVRTEKQMPSLD